MFKVNHSPAHLVVLFTFLLQLCINFRDSQLQQSLVPLRFSLSDVVIAIDTTPSYWAFYFQVLGYLYQNLIRTPGSCVNAV